MNPNVDYDIITVGGGLASAALARSMAEKGARVLVLERETHFKDRIRGETISPWGAVELRALGISDALTKAVAIEVPWFDIYFEGLIFDHRNLPSTSLQRLPVLNWVHHEMEEVLLQAAADAGAEVRRGVTVCNVQPGPLPTLTAERDGRIEELRARLVVCADGRSSVARKWVSFEPCYASYGMLIAGVLLDVTPTIASDTNHLFVDPGSGHSAFMAPQSRGRMRAYAWHPKERGDRMQGAADLPRFINESVKAGVPAEWFSSVEIIGPLATFDGTDNWVNHPYLAGVALIGDAAASSDPAYGQGQSQAVRDARLLRDQLMADQDRDVAGHAYAAQHDRYFAALHLATGWFCKLFFTPGPDADAVRARALPRLAEDGSRMPDLLISGQEVPLDEAVRRRFFGED